LMLESAKGAAGGTTRRGASRPTRAGCPS
jgi:hypothetical protein